ncbi:hypothetical protein Tco_0529560 [Tanacetum coccineum]
MRRIGGAAGSAERRGAEEDLQMAKKAALKERLGFLTHRTYDWSASNIRPYATFPRSIGMRRLRSGMIPRTVPGLPKINKTGQKARSYADKDPGLLPPSRMHMGRAQLLESTLLIPYLPLDNILVYGVFLNPEDKALYVRGDAEVNRVSAPTPRWVSPTTEDEIMAIVRGGKQRGHIPGVGRVLPGQRTVIPTLRLHARTPLMSVFHDEERELTPVDGRFLLKHYANFIQSFETYQAASAAPTSAAHQSPKSTGVEFQQFIHFWTRGRYVVLLICEGFIPFLSGSQMPSYNAANFDLSNVTCNVLETSQSNMAAVLAVNSIDITTEIS